METYEIQLHGHSLKLKTKHSRETLELFKSKVEKKLKQIQESHNQISLEKSLILASLCLAEDNHIIKESISKNLEGLESQVLNVLNDLESSSQDISFQVEQSL